MFNTVEYNNIVEDTSSRCIFSNVCKRFLYSLISRCSFFNDHDLFLHFVTFKHSVPVFSGSNENFSLLFSGRIPKETCQLLKYDLKHRFFPDPKIDIEKLTPNSETLEGLRRFITSQKRCSIAIDIKVFEITYDNTPDKGVPTYTETIKIQISANRSIAQPRDRVTRLTICYDDVIAAVVKDTSFRDSLRLNVSGTLEGGSLIKVISFGLESCCHVIYQFPVSISQCCKPGFFEDGDNCGKYKEYHCLIIRPFTPSLNAGGWKKKECLTKFPVWPQGKSHNSVFPLQRNFNLSFRLINSN